MQVLFSPKKGFLTKNRIVATVVVLALVAVAVIVKDYGQTNGQDNAANNQQQVKAVKIVKINSNGPNFLPSELDSLSLQATGQVKPATSLEVVALGSGTVRAVNFKVGDEVVAGQPLVSLQNSTLSASYSNAQISLANTINNNQALLRLSEENVRQAELGIENSLKAVQTAKIGLDTANQNLTYAQSLQTDSNQTNRQTAVISFPGYLNTVNSALDQINYLIKAEGNNQLPGVAAVLAAGDAQSLITAKNNYQKTKLSYDNLAKLSVDQTNITSRLEQLVTVLSQTRLLVENTVTVLNNTVSSSDFPQSQLSAQKANFNALHTQIVGLQTSVEKTLQGLKTSTTVNQQELDALNNALAIANNQLTVAELGYKNAQVNLERAKQGQQQQTAANQTALDGVQGQLNVLGTQLADLQITAPISGKIVAKQVEMGQELQPGKVLAEIANVQAVKIEFSLPAEEIYQIKLGQGVVLNEQWPGVVSLINPAADPLSKKVAVEVVYDNQNQDLILGTFVNVAIPTESLNLVASPGFILVPLKAVITTQSDSFAWVLDNGQAKKVSVTLGQVRNSLIEVQGLQDGDNLIVEGNKELQEGSLVQADSK